MICNILNDRVTGCRFVQVEDSYSRQFKATVILSLHIRRQSIVSAISKIFLSITSIANLRVQGSACGLQRIFPANQSGNFGTFLIVFVDINISASIKG